MTEKIGNILFLIAGCLWAIELIPQLTKTIRTKSVQDISIFFLTLCFIAYAIFITGCFLIKNWFLFVSHLVPFINVSILYYLVLKYKKSDIKCPIEKGESYCNLGYACDACPYNKDIK